MKEKHLESSDVNRCKVIPDERQTQGKITYIGLYIYIETFRHYSLFYAFFRGFGHYLYLKANNQSINLCSSSHILPRLMRASFILKALGRMLWLCGETAV